MKKTLLKLIPVLVAFHASAAEDTFVTLFNGKDLTGWEQHSGKAEYRVEDGAIVGKTVANTGNSFLCTKESFGDFVLELEFKVAPDMNSGVQFRSEFSTKKPSSPWMVNPRKSRRIAYTAISTRSTRLPGLIRAAFTTKHAGAGFVISRKTNPLAKHLKRVTGIWLGSSARVPTSKPSSMESKPQTSPIP